MSRSVYTELILNLIHKFSPLTADHDSPAPVSQIETWLNERLCKPVALQLPVGTITPNHITIFNVAVAWSGFLCALAARLLEDQVQDGDGSGTLLVLILRITVGVLVFGHMFLDSLDGTYARVSKQTSDLGEILDHGLDSVNVQLISAGLIISIGYDPWVIALTQVFSSFVYNAQIVLYRITGTMVNPPTNGVDAETGGILLHILVGLYIYIFGKTTFWYAFAAFAGIAANLGQIHDWLFFLKKFPVKDKDMDLHLALVGLSIPFVLMLSFGLITRLLFVLMYAVACLRCTGVVVVHTVSEKRRSLPREASMAFSNYHGALYAWAWGLLFLLCLVEIVPSFRWIGNMGIAGYLCHTLFENYTQSLAAINLMPSRQKKP